MIKKLFTKYLPFLLTCSIVSSFNASAKTNVECTKSTTDNMYQVALLQSLMQGEYEGVISVEELKKHGDTGIGTFHDVNGEMIVIDGVVYQALGDGTVKIASDQETVPFSNVAFLKGKVTANNLQANNFKDLEKQLNEIVDKQGKNQFAIATIQGKFPTITVRSELKQEKPYKPLYEVLKTDQTEFNYKNIEGTLVALYFPEYMSSLNMPGWHIHFVSEDKTKGGHVLDLNLANGSLKLDTKTNFDMAIVNRDSFNNKQLGTDISKEIKAVE